ncbi:MAG TPA: [acyl-carrier-protein] S-malonyltransferase [Gammaproteobacteria bacterium]|nr:[acyl-carrier-protein] S-malonyltransferase [Gammaproteobacteria bacterium]|tara:strand:+ start:1828 stop:2754 length:927 start_codon:yes stop_codon:yes gene_type:complete
MSKLAFVFPGQGSQQVGMLSDSQADLAPIFDRASHALGYDLWDLIQNGPEEKLNQTEFTQPALLAASVGLWNLAKERGAKPDVVAGHSLGEYSALVAAEALSFEDAVVLVQKRGQFMQSAVPLGEGSMAAILGLDDNKVIEICEKEAGGEIVQAANFNSPGQVVVAGNVAALERVIEACKDAGAKRAMQLAVSAPFHCQLMQPAADQMAELLQNIEIQDPNIAVLQNVNADYASDPGQIRENLISQMSSAVLWSTIIERMVSDGVTQIVECGPGKVLSGLNRRIDRSLDSNNIASSEDLESVIGSLGS